MGIVYTLALSLAQAHTDIPDLNNEGTGNEPPALGYVGSVASDHAPIGVMADHMHKAGEYMFSYRFMNMNMNGSRIGNNDISPLTTATTIPNRFFGMPGQPPTLRVVPTKMTTQMHMFGGMYAPTDRITLMAMANYTMKDMTHVTFAGGAGTTTLGSFTTRSEGFGDTKLSAMFRLFDTSFYQTYHHAHLNFGVSIPTGSIGQRDVVLAPNGMTPNLRLPYPMQLGSGTFDALPGATYTGKYKRIGWGAQYMSEIRMERNSAGYEQGDKHMATAWASYGWTPWFSTSARILYHTQSKIRGIDPMIVAPVQTADPNNQGGEQLGVSVGFNLLGTHGILKGHRLAAEAIAPLYRNLNGPQLESDWIVIAGWQYANSFLK
ncbi:MAG: transporter [Nitrosomonadales bacterium]|nr:MAG: transporter [Nitrosomonadales bacterium]